MTIEQDIQLEFLTEVQDLLDEFELHLLSYESDPRQTHLLDSMFRVLHTLKGSSFTADLTMFGELVHTFETLLKEIQDNRLPWAATLAQTFIQGCDQLKTYREDLIDNRETSVDFTALMDSVKSFLPASHSSHASDRAQSIIPSFGLFDDDSTSSADVCDPNQNTEPPKASARSPADARPDEPTETPGGVLVVDDERHLREAFTEILTDLNRPIYPAANGQEALEIFQTETIDVIVSDYSMQPMNGIELIAKVRETEQMVPVIFLSAIAPMQELARFIELGTFAFLEKPCEAN